MSYASLHALATALELNVDELELALYSMDNVVKEYKDYPFWLRLYLGSGWFSEIRDEFKKSEVFFLVTGLF